MKHLITLLVLISISVGALPQSHKHAVHIDFDKKIIYVDSLHLPRSINAESILRILPELLERPGENLSTNYDVKVNGMSLGSIYNAALQHLQLTEIERIEVTESPISTYENNGQCGSIDIILREHSIYKKEGNDKFWGTAALGFLYPLNVLPELQINYRSSKFSIQGIAFGEIERHENDAASILTNSMSDNEDVIHGRNQLIGAYMKYIPSSKDMLELKVTEGYTYNRHNEEVNTTILSKTDRGTLQNVNTTENLDTAKTTQLRLLGNYKHAFSKRTNMEFEIQYLYDKSCSDSRDEAFYIQDYSHSNTVSGTLNFKNRFVEGYKKYADLKIGSDYSFAFTDKDYYELNLNPATNDLVKSNNRSRYIMPYLTWECRFGNFLMQAQGEYQIFGYNIEVDGLKSTDYTHNDFTGSVILEQQIGEPHHIRLLYRRKINRPTTGQVYPFEIVLPIEKTILHGNSELVPCHSDEVSLDYLSRYNTGDHKITLDVNGTYNHLSDIVTYTIQDLLGMSQAGKTGYSKYIYRNDSKADVWSANLMAMWQYRTFSLSFTGNLYNNHTIKTNAINGKITDMHSTYYNLALMTAFDLPSGWHSALYIAYHSKVSTTDQELGDCALTQLNIGKKIGRFNIEFYQKSAFTGNVTDITYGSKGDTYNTHTLVRPTVGIDIQYQF